jgi:flagellar protein FlaI
VSDPAPPRRHAGPSEGRLQQADIKPGARPDEIMLPEPAPEPAPEHASAPDAGPKERAPAPAEGAPARGGFLARLRERFVGRAIAGATGDMDRPVTLIPPLPGPQLRQVSFSTVIDGRAYVRISFDPRTSSYLYEVIEPTLSKDETEVLRFLRETLVATMDGRRAVDAADREAHLLAEVDRIARDHQVRIDAVGRARIEYYLVRDLLGFGTIDVLMRDPLIEDVSCDGPHVPLYIFHRQFESVRSNVVFTDEYELDLFVIRLAQRSGKQISIADPLLDATLPDKSRLQASLSKEITTRGSSFTIRKFRADPITPPELARLGTLDARMAAFFWLAMEEGESILIAGGTASGKTTTLNAVSLFIPPQKKIVSIEDTREINLPHDNWVPGLTRTGFGGEVVGGKFVGTIDMYRLLEAALRQRPEYLLVGEVRGAEALTLFQAMATGHAAYSTMHADSVQSAVYRLENEPINVPRIMLQTVDAIVIQALVRVNDKLVRRVKQVVEIAGIDPESGDLLTNTVFEWDSPRDSHTFLGKSYILEAIAEKKNVSIAEIEAELERRALVIDWMIREEIRHIRDVADVVAAYYHEPDELLRKAKGGPPRAHG